MHASLSGATDVSQQIAYAKTKSDTIAKLDGTYKMPEPDLPAKDTEETEPTGFGAALAKAVPVNEQERAKGQKRKADDEVEEEEDDDAEMEMDSDSD